MSKVNKNILNQNNLAILVIDVQNDFCSEKGVFSKNGINIPNIQKTVPKIIKFIEKARKLGFHIIFIKAIYDKRFLTKNIYKRYKQFGLHKLCLSNKSGSDFYKIQPSKNDKIFVKHRYDAFTNLKLTRYLKYHKIKTLVLTGFTSDVCVNATAMSGFMKGFYIIAIKNCLASLGSLKKDVEYYHRYYNALIMNSKEFIDSYNL